MTVISNVVRDLSPLLFSKEDILNNAMLLSTTERAELAAALLASLDGEPEDAVEAAWATEIERRVESVRVRRGEGAHLARSARAP